MSDLIQEWYANFIQVEQPMLFELILASNYMDIRPLLELMCATIAIMIKGKSQAEIKKIFNIVEAPEVEATPADSKVEELPPATEVSTAAPVETK